MARRPVSGDRARAVPGPYRRHAAARGPPPAAVSVAARCELVVMNGHVVAFVTGVAGAIPAQSIRDLALARERICFGRAQRLAAGFRFGAIREIGRSAIQRSSQRAAACGRPIGGSPLGVGRLLQLGCRRLIPGLARYLAHANRLGKFTRWSAFIAAQQAASSDSRNAGLPHSLSAPRR